MNSWLWIILIVYFKVYFIADWTDDLAYLIPIFSLGLWFLYFHGSISCSTCIKSTKGMKPYGTSAYRMGKSSLFCLGKSTILKLKFSYYNNLFGNVLQTSGVIDLITILYVQNSDAKKVFHWKLGFHNFQVISMF